MKENGFSFVNYRVTGSGALFLGRAWGTFSRVVFAYTYMDNIITPIGWGDWANKSRDMQVQSLSLSGNYSVLREQCLFGVKFLNCLVSIS